MEYFKKGLLTTLGGLTAITVYVAIGKFLAKGSVEEKTAEVDEQPEEKSESSETTE